MMPYGIALSPPLYSPTFLQLVVNTTFCITAIGENTVCCLTRGHPDGLREIVLHRPLNGRIGAVKTYCGCTGPWGAAVPQHNIANITAAVIKQVYLSKAALPAQDESPWAAVLQGFHQDWLISAFGLLPVFCGAPEVCCSERIHHSGIS